MAFFWEKDYKFSTRKLLFSQIANAMRSHIRILRMFVGFIVGFGKKAGFQLKNSGVIFANCEYKTDVSCLVREFSLSQIANAMPLFFGLFMRA